MLVIHKIFFCKCNKIKDHMAWAAALCFFCFFTYFYIFQSLNTRYTKWPAQYLRLLKRRILLLPDRWFKSNVSWRCHIPRTQSRKPQTLQFALVLLLLLCFYSSFNLQSKTFDPEYGWRSLKVKPHVYKNTECEGEWVFCIGKRRLCIN